MNSGWLCLFLLFFGAIIASPVFYFSGAAAGQKRAQDIAATYGHGKYIIDEETGNINFEWEIKNECRK